MSDFFLDFVPGEDEPKPKASPARRSSVSSVLQQGGTGASEGIAAMLGLPVDAMAGAINTVGGFVRGQDAGPLIQNPVGGSESISQALSPFMAEEGPATGAERYARRIGQEVGAGAVPLGFAARGAKSVAPLIGLDAASSVGSGIAGQAAEDMGGGAIAQLVASLAGGAAPIGMSRAMTPSPRGPSMDDVRAQADAAYRRVDASQARMSKPERDSLIAAIEGRTKADELDALLHPRANRMLERAQALPDDPRVADVDRLRRVVGRDVAGAPDPGEAAIGVGMKQEIDDYLEGLAAQQGINSPLREPLDAVTEARGATRRIKAAEGVEQAIDRGGLRAATSGTGGNEVNAIRQNLRRILDNPKLRRGYTAQELAAIEEVVRGTPTVNAARLVGRLSPDSGALPLMGNIMSVAGGAAAGSGGGLALGAIPGIAGMAAKSYAESATRRGADQLIAQILNGGPIPKKAMTDTQTRAIAALLAGQAASVGGQ